jgi:hypothetical protein
MKKAFTLTFFAAMLLFVGQVCAQSSVKMLNRHGSEVAPSVLSDSRLKSLRQDLHPGIYLSDGEVVRREKEATTLFTDIASVKEMGKHAFASKTIEMVTITVDDPSELALSIDLTPFNSYERLKYVQVRSSVPTSVEQLSAMVKNMDGNYLLLLNVDPVN